MQNHAVSPLPAPLESEQDRQPRSQPVPLDPKLFQAVSGGSPKGTWMETDSAEVSSPKGTW